MTGASRGLSFAGGLLFSAILIAEPHTVWGKTVKGFCFNTIFFPGLTIPSPGKCKTAAGHIRSAAPTLATGSVCGFLSSNAGKAARFDITLTKESLSNPVQIAADPLYFEHMRAFRAADGTWSGDVIWRNNGNATDVGFADVLGGGYCVGDDFN